MESAEIVIANDPPTESRVTFVAARRSSLMMFGFAALSAAGALVLSYYCLSGLDRAGRSAPLTDAPVYEANAVARDDEAAQHNVAGVNAALTSRNARTDAVAASESELRRATHEQPDRHASAAVPRYCFPERPSWRDGTLMNLAGAVGGSAASHGDTLGQFAPDGIFGSVAPVPEPSAWACAGIFIALLCAFQPLRQRFRG